MAINHVASTLTVNASSATAVVNVPAGTANGDFMLMYAVVNQSNTITTPAGWTPLFTQDPDGNFTARAAVFFRTASSEPASYTVTVSAAPLERCAATISTFRDTSGKSISVDSYSSVTAVTAANGVLTSGSVTTYDANETVWMAVQNDTPTALNFSTPAGMTAANANTAAGGTIGTFFEQRPTAGATGTRTTTTQPPTTTNSHVVLVALGSAGPVVSTNPRLIPGLVAYYSPGQETAYADGQELGVLHDWSPNGNHAVGWPAPASVPGLLANDTDRAISFGTGVRGMVPYAAWMESLTWSVSAVITPTSVSGYQTIVSRYSGTYPFATSTWALRLENNRLQGLIFAGVRPYTFTTTTALVAGTTYDVAMTYGGGVVRVYVNGVQEAADAMNNVSPIGINTIVPEGIYIGDNRINQGEYFTGAIDEVSYFTSTLTAPNLLSLSTARQAGNYATAVLGLSPAAYYRMGDDPAVALLTDSAPFGRHGTLEAPSVSEGFAAMPVNITKTAGVVIDTGWGMPAPSLQSNGMSNWWYFTDPKWYVYGDFTLAYHLFISSVGAARDIANMGFFITNPGLNANGYMFRVENGGDCGFFEVINGVHGNIIGTPLGVAGAPVDVWLEVTIQVVGSTATARVRRNDNNAAIGNAATVTLPAGNRQGTFGQKHDGAGGSNGHRWDNIVLVSPGSAVANNPASTTTGLVASDSDKAMVFNRGSRGRVPYGTWMAQPAMSVSAVVTPAHIAGWPTIAARYDGNQSGNFTNSAWTFRIDSNGKLAGYIFMGNAYANVQGATTLVAGTAYDVAMTWNTFSLTLWVNGVQDGQNNTSLTGINASAFPLTIGSVCNTDGQQQESFDGVIDEVIVCGSVHGGSVWSGLRSARVSGNATAYANYVKTMNPIAWYRLSDPPLTLKDSSGNARHGFYLGGWPKPLFKTSGGPGGVRRASTGNVPIASASTAYNMDGSPLPGVGTRVLLKNQTIPAENGIYVVQPAPWIRASDMDSWAEVPGALVTVQEGASNGGTSWVCTSAAGGTLGTTAITWTTTGTVGTRSRRIWFPSGSGYYQLPNILGSATQGEIFADLLSPGLVTNGLWAFGSSQNEEHFPYPGDSMVYTNFGLATGQRQSYTPLPNQNLTSGTWRLRDIWSAPSDWSDSLDTVPQKTYTGGTVSFDTAPVLGRGKNAGGLDSPFTDGSMGTILIYNRKLTTQERADVVAWYRDQTVLPSVEITRSTTWDSLQVVRGNFNWLGANASSFETDVSAWTSQGSSPPTRASSTTRATAGTKSMLVTWTGGGGVPYVRAAISFATVIGMTYRVSADVWVPSGSPDVRVGVESHSNGAYTSVKDAWITVTHTFSATATAHNILLQPNPATLAGTVYMDNVFVLENAVKKLVSWNVTVADSGVPPTIPKLAAWWDPSDINSMGLVSIDDDFNRANSTTSLGSTTTGQAWAVSATGGVTAQAGISSNRAYFSSFSGSATAFAVIDAGAADVALEVTFPIAYTDQGLTWRYVDVNNQFAMNKTTAYRRLSGGFATIITFSQAFTTGDRVKVVLSGDTHIIYKNDVQVGTFTDANFNTATKHGIASFNDTAGRFEDFKVYQVSGRVYRMANKAGGTQHDLINTNATIRPYYDTNMPGTSPPMRAIRGAGAEYVKTAVWGAPSEALPWTFFAVMDVDSGTPIGHRRATIKANSPSWRIDSFNGLDVGPMKATAGADLVVVEWQDGPATRVWINGALMGSTFDAGTTPNTPYLDKYALLNNGIFDGAECAVGLVGENGVYKGVLSDANRDTLSSYLMTKWAIKPSITVIRSTTWDTTQPVALTRATTWDTLQIVSLPTRATTWNIQRLSTQINRSTTWDTLQVVGYIPPLAADDFTAADNPTGIWNGTASQRSTPIGNFPWVGAASALWGTSAGRAVSTAADGNLTIDPGTTEGVLEATFWSGLGAQAWSGFTMRRTDGSNQLRLFAPGYWMFAKFVAGAQTMDVATGGVVTPNTTYRVRVVTNGPTIDLYVDNAFVLSYTITDPVLLTGRRVGLVQTTTGAADSSWDDFAFRALPVAPVTTLTRNATWDTRRETVVFGGRSTSWRVRQAVTPTKTTTWDTTFAILRTRPTTWDSTAAVTKALSSTTWKIRQAVTRTRSTTWNVAPPLVPVQISRGSTTWKVRALTTKAPGQTTWRVRQAVVATRSTTWDVLAPVTVVTRSTTWDALRSVTPFTRSTTWDVTFPAVLVRSTTWDALFVRTVTRGSSTWRVGQAVVRARNTTWNIKSASALTKVVVWDTLKVVVVPSAAGPAEQMFADTVPSAVLTGTYTLGAQFVVNEDGYITHVRYFHVDGCPPATHTVSVWDANTQAKLATTIFTPSGGG